VEVLHEELAEVGVPDHVLLIDEDQQLGGVGYIFQQ
jgi:hypothetical protein